MKTICFTVILSMLIGPAVSLGQSVRSREDLLSRLEPRKQAWEAREGHLAELRTRRQQQETLSGDDLRNALTIGVAGGAAHRIVTTPRRSK